MRDTVRLGRLRGVPIGVNWSLLAIIVFLGFGLAGNRLPVDVPGRTGLAYAVAGGLTAVALIVAVLVHELGHAVVARQAGMKVDGITLSWMGGVTRIEGDAPTPGRELAIAVVGPVISLALGGVCWLARIAIHAAGHHELLAAALGWLATINILLAAFNMLPAAPLDGGRVLHAAIWKATKDRWRAARLASRAGIGLGILVVAAGTVITVQRRNNIDGLIVAVMGWWLITAARSEEQVAGVHRALDGLTVADLMRPVGAAPGWITIRAFVEQYDSVRPGWVWLLEDWNHDGYQAVVAGEALRVVPPRQWDALRPVDVAVPAQTTAGAGPADEALEVLNRTGGRQVILVVDGGYTVGAVLPSDVAAALRAGGRRTARTADRTATAVS